VRGFSPFQLQEFWTGEKGFSETTIRHSFFLPLRFMKMGIKGKKGKRKGSPEVFEVKSQTFHQTYARRKGSGISHFLEEPWV